MEQLLNQAIKDQPGKKLKNGHSPLADNKPFRAIKFKGSIGVIVGDNGLVWLSKNNGMDWEDISIATDLNLFDFDFLNDQIIAVSEKGQIIRFAI